MPLYMVYIERPRATRFPTNAEMEECDAHTDKGGGCDGCPRLRHASRSDVYCYFGHVWPTEGAP